MGTQEPPKPGQSARVLLYPGCTIAEVIELATRLTDGGVDVRYVAAGTAAGILAITDRSGLRLTPDSPIDAADPASVDLVVIPGGDPAAIMNDPKVSRLLGEVADGGGIIAGICAGVLVIAAAGLLVGRSVTHNYRPPWAPPEVSSFVAHFWEGAIVEPDPSVGVVVDDRLVTALPNATVEFAMTVCRLLGLYSDDRADRVGRHLRGEYVAELYDGS
ncbi:MAG: DJ-1/PfpI family protein [Actinomycetota bacterium]